MPFYDIDQASIVPCWIDKATAAHSLAKLAFVDGFKVYKTYSMSMNNLLHSPVKYMFTPHM